MSVNCKYCYLCDSYKEYYVKINYKFYKKSYGDCKANHNIVNLKDTCPDWKPRVKDENFARISLNKLEKLTDELNDLILLIKSNYDKE